MSNADRTQKRRPTPTKQERPECPDELRAGPFTIKVPGLFAADNQQEAEEIARGYLTRMTKDQITQMLAFMTCSGGGLCETPTCIGFQCKDGRCSFDYEISKTVVVQVKPPGKTVKLNKPTKARWSGELEVW